MRSMSIVDMWKCTPSPRDTIGVFLLVFFPSPQEGSMKAFQVHPKMIHKGRFVMMKHCNTCSDVGNLRYQNNLGEILTSHHVGPQKVV